MKVFPLKAPYARSSFVMLSALAAPLIFAPVTAQQQSGSETELDALEITASAFSDAPGEAVQPASILAGDELNVQIDSSSAATIGEVLQNQPGISNAGFGPGVGRPVIRGQGGPRVRTLSNGLDTFDVSNLSPDHAVTLSVPRAATVEVLRGPATLLYGSGAIGGAVNVVDDSIPLDRINGVGGDVFVRTDSASGGRLLSGTIRGGSGNWAFQVGGDSQETDDLNVPRDAIESGTLENSATDTRNYSVGTSYIGQRGKIGVSFERLTSLYGIPGGHGDEEEGGEEEEEVVRIDLEQERVRVTGELYDPLPGFESASFQYLDSDYEHVELEGDEDGTLFDVDASALRGRLDHNPISVGGGELSGVVGVHIRSRDFSAIGEEAFVPPVETKSNALFVVEKLEFGQTKYEAGLRVEQVDHDTTDGNPDRDFNATSLSLGTRHALSQSLSLSAQLARSERAPAAEELYSNGPHLATETFEFGDVDLDTEKATSIDIGLNLDRGRLRAGLNLFYTDYNDYIFQQFQDDNGDGDADEEEGLTILNYQQGAAEFYGYELKLEGDVWRQANNSVTLGAWTDYVRAKLDDNGGDLPRITPMRFGLDVTWRSGAYSAGLNVLHANEQDDLAALETSTDSYTRTDFWLEYAISGSSANRLTLRFFVNNIGDKEIRQHTSFLKDIAPQAGRSGGASLRYTF